MPPAGFAARKREDGRANAAAAGGRRDRPPDRPSAQPVAVALGAGPPQAIEPAPAIGYSVRTGSPRRGDEHGTGRPRRPTVSARRCRRWRPSEVGHRAARTLRTDALAELRRLGDVV